MKKQTLLLLAGGMLAFASCNNEAPGGGMSQASIDSAVDARVEAMRIELTAQNDSLINAMALIKADSIIAAMKSGAPAPKPVAKSAGKPAAKPVTTQPAASSNTEPGSTNSKDGRFNGTESKHNKDARFNEEAAKQESAKKKADRFK